MSLELIPTAAKYALGVALQLFGFTLVCFLSELNIGSIKCGHIS